MAAQIKNRTFHYIILVIYIGNWFLPLYIPGVKTLFLNEIILFIVTTAFPIGLSYFVFNVLNKDDIFENNEDMLISSFFSVYQITLAIVSALYLIVTNP